MTDIAGEKSRGDSPSSEYVEHDEHLSPGRYIATRLPTLKPPMHKAPNPFSLLRLLNTQQWLFFLVAFLAWSWDAFDFFTVSLTVEELSEEFDKKPAQITWGITLVLMFRSVGSVIFGGRPLRSLIIAMALIDMQVLPLIDMDANGLSS